MKGIHRVLFVLGLALILGLLFWLGSRDTDGPTAPEPAPTTEPAVRRPDSPPAVKAPPPPATTGAVVRVIDPAGRAVGGAVVEAIPDRNYETRWRERSVSSVDAEARGTTDAGGRVLLTPLTPGKWTFRATADGKVSRPFHPVRLRAGPPVELFLLIGVAHKLTGTVRNADGTPSADARVALSPEGVGALRRVVTTEADGSYRAGSLAPGLYRVAAAPAGGAFSWSSEIVVPAVTTRDITLRATGVISGRVTRLENGSPIEGATVYVGISISVGTSVLTATTDADGCYRVENVPHRKNTRITALAPGCVPADEEHDYHWLYIDAGSERVVDFRLRAGAAVSGVVRGPDGEPVAGAEVALFGDSAWRQTFHRETTTDRDGTFRFTSLPTGHASVRAGAPGLHQPGFPEDPWNLRPRRATQKSIRPIEIPTSGEVTVTIDLAPTARVEGTVLDDAGRAAAGVLVGVSQERVPRVETGPDGAFAIDSVRSGAGIIVTAEPAVGMPGSAEPIEAAPGDTVRGVVISLPASAVVRGTVRAESGAALRGATVRLGLLEEDEPGMLYWESAPKHPVGPDGTFEIPITEPAGWFAVLAEAEGMPQSVTETARIEPGGRIFTVQLVLPDPAVIDGIVVDAVSGEPVAGARVSATSTIHDAVQRPATGADGRFETRVRPGEEFDLHVWAGGYVYLRRYGVTAGTRDIRVEIQRAVEIRGRVLTEDGAPAPNLEVRAVAQGSRNGKAWSGADGRFVIRGIPAGTYQMSVRPDEDGGNDYVATSMPSVETGGPEIVITVTRAARIEGRVVDEDGVGLPGEQVTARDSETHRGRRRVLSGPDGSFVLPVPAAAVYSVTAGRPGRPYVPTTVEGVGPGTLGLTITVRRGLTVAGRMVDEHGATVEGLWSSLGLGSEADRNFYIFGEVQEDGTFEFRGLPEGAFTLYFQPWPLEGWLARTVEGIPAGTTDLLVEIDPAGTISGVVVDEKGRPVEEAGVISTGEDRPWWSWGAAFDTWTDHKGRFTVGGLPLDGKFLIVVGGSEEGWSSAAEADVVTGREDLRFVIRKGLVIRGAVQDAAGEPMDEAVVAVLDGHGLPLAWTEVDGDGMFELHGLSAGTVELWVLLTEEGAKPVRVGTHRAGESDVRLALPAD